MKTTFCAFIAFINLFFCCVTFTQVEDNIIRISPEIGDTISLSERNYYNLFPGVKDFQYALFNLSKSQIYELKIWYRSDEGLLLDTIIYNSAELFGNYKSYVRQINIEASQNFEADCGVTVKTLDGNVYSGKVILIQDNSIILCPDSMANADTFSLLKYHTKLNLQDIDSIKMQTENIDNVFNAVKIGGAIGFGTGLAIGLAIPSNYHEGPNSMFSDGSLNVFKGLAIGTLGMLTGATIGLVIGLITSSPEETVDFRTALDLEQFKEYLHFEYSKKNDTR